MPVLNHGRAAEQICARSVVLNVGYPVLSVAVHHLQSLGNQTAWKSRYGQPVHAAGHFQADFSVRYTAQIQAAEFRPSCPSLLVFFCSFLDSVYLSLQELSQVWGEARWPQALPGYCFLIGSAIKAARVTAYNAGYSHLPAANYAEWIQAGATADRSAGPVVHGF